MEPQANLDLGLRIAELLVQEIPTSARPPVLGWTQTARGRAFEQKKAGALILVVAKAGSKKPCQKNNVLRGCSTGCLRNKILQGSSTEILEGEIISCLSPCLCAWLNGVTHDQGSLPVTMGRRGLTIVG